MLTFRATGTSLIGTKTQVIFFGVLTFLKFLPDLKTWTCQVWGKLVCSFLSCKWTYIPTISILKVTFFWGVCPVEDSHLRAFCHEKLKSHQFQFYSYKIRKEERNPVSIDYFLWWCFRISFVFVMKCSFCFMQFPVSIEEYVCLCRSWCCQQVSLCTKI
jgi:hypothetical protein